ncbi:hypothetical protein Hanom_Chr01g00076711 [Helianthus anomalus]
MDLEEDEEGMEVEENVIDVNPVVDEAFDLNVAQEENQVNSGTEALVHDGLDSGEQMQKGEKTSTVKKRKGFCRKKGSRNKSASLVGNDRPKKRHREGEDVFLS